MKKLHAIILGATGATGQEILKLLLNNSNFSKVTIFVRKNIGITHDKLTVHKIDFSKLKDYKKLIYGDVFFSCLGTTRSEAGGKKNQYLVDYTYQFDFAKMASENNIKIYSLISSLGANQNSFFFYPRIKGALENRIKCLDFKLIHIFQPPSLIRQPSLLRYGEKITISILTKLNRIGLLKSFKPLHVYDLADKMVSESLLDHKKKIKIYKPKDIKK